MQLLHGVYNVQTYLEGSELKLKWKAVCVMLNVNVDFRRLPCPVLTRWWYVGVCAFELLEDFKVWKQLNLGIRRDPLTQGTAIADIVSHNVSLMEEPMINSDLRLLAAVHSWWMNPNFKFLQGGDSDENRNGYQARHMLERYFTMDQELN